MEPSYPERVEEKFGVGQPETRNAVYLKGQHSLPHPSSSFLNSLLPTLVNSYMPGHKQDC